MRVGVDPKGIMGSGYITSLPFLAPHWKNEDKMVYRVNIEFDVLFDTEHEEILTLDKLKFKTKVKQVWTPQSSGILIKREVVGELERAWEEFVNDTTSA
ncbi:MAG: hypothetical protein WDO15_19710 [Bacteroidota bacterium]